MENKPTITIGIPAYNEEQNIGVLLNSLLQQKHTSYVLRQIIVVCDGSTDRTENVIRSIKDKRITCVVNPRRMGQVYSQNTIFRQAKTDIVVLLEADTIPQTSEYIEKLIEPIIQNPSTGMIQGRHEPIRSHVYIGKALEAQRQIYLRFLSQILPKASLHCSGRGGRAFLRVIYRSLVWPLSVPEDMYALLWCMQKSTRIVYQKKAIMFYRAHQTYQDYKKERLKISAAFKKIYNYFEPNLVNKIYQPKLMETVMMAFLFAFKHPFFFGFYCYLKFRTFLERQDNSFTDFWETTPSTKVVIAQS